MKRKGSSVLLAMMMLLAFGVNAFAAETKRKTSASLKGRAKSAQHKRAISVALKAYWETIPDSIDSVNK